MSSERVHPPAGHGKPPVMSCLAQEQKLTKQSQADLQVQCTAEANPQGKAVPPRPGKLSFAPGSWDGYRLAVNIREKVTKGQFK